jgi:hypothetical protein
MKKICKILVISTIVVIIGAITILSVGCSGNSSLKLNDTKVQDSKNSQDNTGKAKSQGKDQTSPKQDGKPDQAPDGGFMIDSNTIIADILGISVDDFTAKLNAGKNIAEVANEVGIEAQKLIDSYLEEFANKLDEAVKNSKITQEEAERMLENEKNTIKDRINNTMPNQEGKPDVNK